MKKPRQMDLEDYLPSREHERLIGTPETAAVADLGTGHDGRHRYLCRECNEPFRTDRTDQYFCSRSCRRSWNNRRMVRGAQLYDVAMAYRQDRLPGSMTKLTQLLDRWITEDKAAGRRSFSLNPIGQART